MKLARDEFKPFLTIGIPTWNRSACLKQNLDSLVMQINSFAIADVEIMIMDNASDDDTQAVVKPFVNLYPFVTYNRHQVNLGANANFQQVVMHAKGQYVWLLGDDDLLVADCIVKVMRDLREYKPAAAVGAAVYAESQEKATHQHISSYIMMDRKAFGREEIIALAGKISGLIFHKSSVIPILDIAEKMIKEIRTPWPHLVWLIMLMNETKNRLLVLPYGTNQLLSENWHNLLFTGQSLIQIHFIDYQKLIVAMKWYLASDYYGCLMSHSIAYRISSLVKSVLYGSYVDSYWGLLKFSYGFLPKIHGWINRIYFSIFVLVPLMLPRTMRKLLFTFATCVRYKRLNRTISKIKKTILLTHERGQLSSARRVFDSRGL